MSAAQWRRQLTAGHMGWQWPRWQHLFLNSALQITYWRSTVFFRSWRECTSTPRPPWPHHDLCQWASAARAWSQNINVLRHQRVLFCLCFFFFTFAGLELKRMEGETSTMTILAYVRKAFYPFVYWIIAMWAGGRTEMMINVQPLRFQLNDMKWHEAALK